VIVLDRCHLFCRGEKSADVTVFFGSTDIGRGLSLSILLSAGVLSAPVLAYNIRGQRWSVAAEVGATIHMYGRQQVQCLPQAGGEPHGRNHMQNQNIVN
jgi:hypothetical protein